MTIAESKKKIYRKTNIHLKKDPATKGQPNHVARWLENFSITESDAARRTGMSVDDLTKLGRGFKAPDEETKRKIVQYMKERGLPILEMSCVFPTLEQYSRFESLLENYRNERKKAGFAIVSPEHSFVDIVRRSKVKPQEMRRTPIEVLNEE